MILGRDPISSNATPADRSELCAVRGSFASGDSRFSATDLQS